MFMFGSKKTTGSESTPSRTSTGSFTNEVSYTKIGKGTKIIGQIISPGNIRIDGDVDGNLKTDAKAVIGETGFLKGDLECENADVFGRITGKLVVRNLLFLKSTAVVEGEIQTNKLVVEEDATFNGTCSMNGSKASQYGNKEEQGQKAKTS